MKHYTEKFNDRLRRMQKNNFAEYNTIIAQLAARDDVVMTESGRLSTKTTATADILDILIPTSKSAIVAQETNTDKIVISETIEPEVNKIVATLEDVECKETESETTDTEVVNPETVVNEATEIEVAATEIETTKYGLVNKLSKLTVSDIEHIAGILNRSIKVMEDAGLIASSDFYKQFAKDIRILEISVNDRPRLSVSKLKNMAANEEDFITLTNNWMTLSGLNERSKSSIKSIINK